MTGPYADAVDHLAAELRRLDVLLKRELVFTRVTASAPREELRGLVITEEEIDAIAQQEDYFGERWREAARHGAALEPLDARACALAAEIEARCASSRAAGMTLPLAALAGRLALSRREVDILLLALAPELEPRYEQLFGYLQNDVTRRRPSVDLGLDLVSRTPREKLAARRLLRPGAPLVDHRLVVLSEESHDRPASWLRRFLKADEAVVQAIVDGVVRPAPAGDAPAPEVDARARARLATLAEELAGRTGETTVVHLVGPSEAALRSAADWLCRRIGRAPSVVDRAVLERDEEATALRTRDVVLSDGVLVVNALACGDAGTAPPPERDGRALSAALARVRDLVIVLGALDKRVALPAHARLWLVEVRPPDAAERRMHWADGLGSVAPVAEVGRLADTFRFGRREVAHTVSLATSLAKLRDPGGTVAPSFPDVLDAGRFLTTPDLRRFAVRVEPRFTWADIVLPKETCAQLGRLATRVRLRHEVHEVWGFGRKLVGGGGLSVLFTGPPGTGKTMAADVLAKEIGLDLYRIDLSNVISKYIGETEKHLEAIFREAEESQAILFFDEADALFGKRTEVKDAHDRYANVETSFLLQRVERYDGVVVLATNQQRNIDEAFVRRLHDVVDFPFPDETLRERIWRAQFPKQAKVDGDLDLPFLARAFKLTGANIKSVVLDAAFRAADQGARIGMRHLVLATRTELQKQGRVATRAEFDRYYPMIAGTEAAPAVT